VPELLLSIPLALLILLACHEVGRLVLWLLKLDDPLGNSTDNALLKFASGYIAIGFILSIFGHLHLFRSGAMWVLVLLFAGTSFLCSVRRKSLLETWDGIKSFGKNAMGTSLNKLLLIVLLLALLMDFVLTCVPTTAWDALTYHYPMPAIWLRAGYFVERLDICYSELPFGSEMMFALAFGLGGLNEANTGVGHLAANHLTWLTGLFAVVALVSITRRLGNSGSENIGVWDCWTPGLVAAVAFMSLPIVFVEEMEGGYIENFLVFFTLLMLTALLHYRDNRNPKLIIAIGVIAGGLLASKHTSLFVDVIALVGLIVWLIRDKKEGHVNFLWLAGFIAILIAMPWYMKSAMHTSDPAWPFFTALEIPYQKLHQPTPDIMYWSNPNVERSVLGFLGYIPRLSWDESLTQFKFRLLSWYFLPLLPFTIYWSFVKGKNRFIALTTWILILLIYLLAPGEPRYMLAAWGLYAALGAWGLFTFFNRFPWVIKFVLPILLLLPIGNSLVERSVEVNKRIPTIIGTASVEDYFEKSLDIWPLVNYINTETEPDEKVLMVEPRIFYIQRPYKIWYPFATPDGININGRYIDKRERLQNLDFSHLMLTLGPNYRAIGLFNTFIHLEGHPDGLRDEIFIPQWIYDKAAYTEYFLALKLADDSVRIVSDTFEWRLGNYDVASMGFINHLIFDGYLEKVELGENADRAGAVLRFDFNPTGEEDIE